MFVKGGKVVATVDLSHRVQFGGEKQSTIKKGTIGTIVGVQMGTGHLMIKFVGHANPKFLSDLLAVKEVV